MSFCKKNRQSIYDEGNRIICKTVCTIIDNVDYTYIINDKKIIILKIILMNLNILAIILIVNLMVVCRLKD